jgi:hypothetical protein
MIGLPKQRRVFMMNGKEMLFVAKALAWRMENPDVRSVSIMFAEYGLYAYLHGKHRTCEIAWVHNESELEKAIQTIEEREREIECQSEVLEEVNSTISCDAEQDGTTVGTNV